MLVAGLAFNHHVAASNHLDVMMHSRTFCYFSLALVHYANECLEKGHKTQQKTTNSGGFKIVEPCSTMKTDALASKHGLIFFCSRSFAVKHQFFLSLDSERILQAFPSINETYQLVGG